MTLGGAWAPHLENQVGALVPGVAADVVCVDIERPSLAPREAVLSNLVYANDRSAVRHVHVVGEGRARDGQLLGYDGRELASRATVSSACVMERTGLGADVAPKSGFRWLD